MPDINFVDNPGSAKPKPASPSRQQVDWTKPPAEPKAGAGRQEPPQAPPAGASAKPVAKPAFSLFKKEDSPEGFEAEKREIAAAQELKNSEKAKNRPALDIQEPKKAPGGHEDIKNVIKKRLAESKIKIGEGIVTTNLISGEDTIIIDWKRNFALLAITIFLSVFAVAVFYGFIYFKEQKASLAGEELSQEILALRQKREVAIENARVVDELREKLAKVSGLLEQHIYWTNFFAFLEDTILKDVKYQSGVSGTTAGEFTFSASAPNFASVTNQLKIFKNNEFVESAEVLSASYVTGDRQQSSSGENPDQEVVFDITLRVKPELFLRP